MKKSVTLESEHQDRNPGSLKTPELAIRTSSAGIKLIPQPSNDSQDPLVWIGPTIKRSKYDGNDQFQTWTALKKTFTTLIWCLGAFVSTALGLGNALGYFFQAEFYHKDAIAISYSVSTLLLWNERIYYTLSVLFRLLLLPLLLRLDPCSLYHLAANSGAGSSFTGPCSGFSSQEYGR